MSLSTASVLVLSFLLITTPTHATIITVHSPNPGPDLFFGQSIDSANGIFAVGLQVNQGEVLVYDASNGSLLRTILNPSNEFGAGFGWSVEVSGSLLAVGSPFATVNGLDFAGKVYLFNVATGTLVATLVSSVPQQGGNFGRSLAMDYRVLAVGAPRETVNGIIGGQVHVFDVQTWKEILTLASPHPEQGPGFFSGFFGGAIDISNGHMIVGAQGENSGAGRAYIFNTLTGSLVSTLVPSNPVNEYRFGISVAIHGHDGFVGAPYDTSGFGSGAVYDFNILTGSVDRIFVSSLRQAGGFGWSLSISGPSLIVGSPFDNVTLSTEGRVYVFSMATGALTNTLVSPDTGGFGSFGLSVDSTRNSVIVGAPAQVVNGAHFAGAVYIYRFTGKIASDS